MMDHVVAALFFLRGTGSSPLTELAPRTGAKDLVSRKMRNPDPTKTDLTGLWGGFFVQFAFCQLPTHGCLELVFSQKEFYQALFDDESRAPNAPVESLLQDFGLACAQLKPEVAVILATPTELLDNWIRSVHQEVIGNDPNVLLGQGYKIVFVNSQLAEALKIPAGHDTSRISQGVMVFEGTGANRWG